MSGTFRGFLQVMDVQVRAGSHCTAKFWLIHTLSWLVGTILMPTRVFHAKLRRYCL